MQGQQSDNHIDKEVQPTQLELGMHTLSADKQQSSHNDEALIITTDLAYILQE